MKTPQFWRRPSLLGCLLWPLSQLYRLCDNAVKSNSTAMRAPLPVISIGNVTAGGAGKTPTALALLPMVQALGFTPHFLTRGYGAEKPLTAHRVVETDTASRVGDEALLLAQIAPTWVGSERIASARAAKAAGATVAVCDDALQHYRLAKDVSFLVIDGPYGLGNGFLLPAGPLRESLDSAMARCDAVILIGTDRKNLAARVKKPVFYANLVPVEGAAQMVRGKRWLAFAGIGRPEKFFDTVRMLGAEMLNTRAFADHHVYTDADINGLLHEAAAQQAQLLTTEKDAVKLTAAQRAQVMVLAVTLQFEEAAALQDFLAARLANPS